MKKSILIMALLVLSTVIFSQTSYRGQRVTKNATGSANAFNVLSAKSSVVNEGIQIDIFFSAPVNPASFGSKNVLVNSKEVANLKPVFNREGTQVRFVVNTSFPVELKLKNIEAGDGSVISEKTIILEK